MIPTFRIAIIIIAAIEIYFFSDIFRLSFETLTESGAQWFNVASALAAGVFAPLLAITAGALSLAGKRLGLAGILLCVAPVFYLLPVIAFGISVMIYGF
jgi:hypothetical protein